MDKENDYCNISQFIRDKIGKNLHNKLNHPIEIIKKHIYNYFDSLVDYQFEKYDNLSPFVSVEDNFDKLLIPKDHIARSKSDTYYVNEKTVLRTHTSAHQNELLSKKHTAFLVTGDVYRKDEIDKYHFPVFHQMEGVALVKNDRDAKDELIIILSGLIEYLFPKCQYRVKDDYFPFTHPSFEIEVYYDKKWIEVLGCGVVQPEIIRNNNLTGSFWAFGLGLERLALVLFKIPDIRYIWSQHHKFIDQFKDGKIIPFEQYSELPTQYNDISFWIKDDYLINNKWIQENDFYEIIRDVGEEWIESVIFMDSFYHPKHNKYSHMYRITYSPNDPSLKNPSEFTQISLNIHNKIRDRINNELDITLR